MIARDIGEALERRGQEEERHGVRASVITNGSCEVEDLVTFRMVARRLS